MDKTGRIVIIGNKGDINKPDGQVIRTRTVTKTILETFGDKHDVLFLNTSGKGMLKIFLNVFLIKNAIRIVIMPGPRAYYLLLVLIAFLGVAHKTVHVAIGGWLPEYLNNTFFRAVEQRFISVLVQTKSIKKELEVNGLENVKWFPNYRKDTGERINIKDVKMPPKRFVFYSRVIKEKGIFEAMGAIEKLREEGKEVSLDIYGPIYDDILDIIRKKSKKCRFIEYKGVLHQGNILTTLSNYDCMIFPTQYKGEGFPGAVLESMLAGVPVIATNWKFNREIVIDKKNGLICEKQTVDDVLTQIKLLLEDSDLYRSLCVGALVEGQKYTEEKVVPILSSAMYLDS